MTTQNALATVEADAGALNAPVAAEQRDIPANIEAEQALLGSLLVNNQAYEYVADFLAPEHFAEDVHGRIYNAVIRIIERGQQATPVTLKAFFDKDERLAAVGGAQYLVDLADAAMVVINVVDYGRLIYDLHLRRELIGLGQDVVNNAYDHDIDLDASSQIERIEGQLFTLASQGTTERTYLDFGTAVKGAVAIVEETWKRDGKLAGVSTGLTELDRLLGGLHPSDLIILAGRPSMGKTTLATNIAFYAADHVKMIDDKVDEGAVAAFFSLEMSAEQLATRILSDQAGISADKIRKGEMSNDEFQKLVEASNRLNSLPLFIDDTPAITISTLRTRARRLKRQHKLGLIVVDYLQLMRASLSSKGDNRVQELSEITRGLKAIAKEINVPVIALSQLSRAVEQREDKRPQLSDLRESGSIEQDADMVLFVYREEYYLSRAEPSQGIGEGSDKFNEKYGEWQERLEQAQNIAEVIVAKQRHGPIGKVRLHFDGNTTKFSNLVADI